MDIYGRVMTICKEKGMSMRMLEEKACIGHGTVRMWNSRSPRLNILIAVAGALEVPLCVLIEEVCGKERV